MAAHRVLIVDDNPPNLKLMTLVLSSRGFDVRACNDSEAAIPSVQAFRPDVILLDVQMPGIDGLALAGMLRRNPETCSIPIIAVTAYAMKGDQERTLAAGCDAYVAKPIDTRALPGIVLQYASGGRASTPG